MANILVCEDDKLMGCIIEHALKDDSHNVKIVQDGQLATTELKSDYYQLVISDLVMPVMNGLDLIDFIRNNLKSEIPVLIMSGLSEHEHVRKAKQTGANDFLPKPINADKLRRKVQQLLRSFPELPILKETEIANPKQ